MIALLISFGIIGAVIWILLIRYGIQYCLKNNAMGVVILFITLNILGLVLGWAILWNNKNILKDNFWQDVEKLSKIREERKEQNKFTIKKFREWREKKN